MEANQDQAEINMDKQAKTARDNQQMFLYMFVAITMVLTWGLGLMEFSFIWTLGLIILTFFVWHSKVMKLIEDHLRYKEVQLHRKRALRQGETAEWLNLVINRWWLFSAGSIRNLMKRHLDPLLQEVKPAYIENIELQSFVIGDTPHLKYVKVFEPTPTASGLQTATWSQVAQPGPKHQVVLEGDIGLHSDDFKIVFKTRLGSKWMGMNLDVIIEKLNITGCIQLVLSMNVDSPFPHIANVAVSFREKPEVWFNIRMLKAVQMMEIPMLKSWIHSLVMDGLTEALVDPGKIDIKMSSSNSYAPAKSKAKTRAQGVLTLTVGCDQTKGSMFTDDLRYCVVRLGEQRQYTSQTQGSTAWTDTCAFLVEDIKQDKLIIKYKSKRLLSTNNLAQFDIALGEFPLEHQKLIDTSVEEKVSRWQTGGTVKLNLQLMYHPLPTIEDHVETLQKQPVQNNPVVSGVLHVCVHSAANLLALDRNGTSDPYCIIFRNGKKLKTTHYVCKTRNPSWEVNAEFLVTDFTRNMLSFMVYDWDGHNASEDDFLGSAYYVPNHDNPNVLQKSLTLGYNVLNQGQVDNSQLGTITVSVVFRPVDSVNIKSEVDELPNLNDCDYMDKHKIFMNSALAPFKKHKQILMKDKKCPDSMGVGSLLSMGHGLLELNILRAKDLVAMDSNGFSDPFCEVKIGNERKFTTSIKKKTLNPAWEEWVTMQLPKNHEMLEIVVWDRDPFFKKDFLGSVSFSLDDLKKHSQNPVNDGWHQLQRIRSGYIQLHFKVISEDVPSQHVEVSITPDSMLENGSVIEEGDNSPQHGTPNNKPSSMSPIQEMGTLATKLSSAMVSASTKDKRPTKPSTSPPARSKSLQESLVSSSNTLPSRLTPITSSIRLSPGRRFNSFRLTRSASDASLRSGHKGFLSFTNRIQRGNSFNQIKSDSQSTIEDNLTDSPVQTQGDNSGEKYFDVRGRILRTQGYQGNGQAYCKIRIDSRPKFQRYRKSSIGKVLCKTKSFDSAILQEENIDFNIDNGRGVAKDSLLIVDIKNSSKEHIATRGFILFDLLGDFAEITTWLELDNGLKVEIYLCQGFMNEKKSNGQRKKTFINMLKK